MHAYAVLGAYELKDKDGKVQYRLLKIRNPHGSDDAYNGSWSDSDTKWTPEFKAQVPYVKGNDGQFFMEINDFMQSFTNLYVNYDFSSAGWVTTTHTIINDNGKSNNFQFTVNSK
jgi:hypothetical protein